MIKYLLCIITLIASVIAVKLMVPPTPPEPFDILDALAIAHGHEDKDDYRSELSLTSFTGSDKARSAHIHSAPPWIQPRMVSGTTSEKHLQLATAQ